MALTCVLCFRVGWPGGQADGTSQGPSLFLLPPLFHQLYADLGTTLAEHVELLQCHPNYVIHYHDGEKVTLSSDRAQLRQEVEKWEGPGGGERLEAFLT